MEPVASESARRRAAGPSRRRALAAVLSSVLLGGLPALADDPTPPFPDVEVDLSGRLFESVLPFDVPFLLHGAVPLTTQRVDVWYIQADRGFRVVEPRAAGCPSGDGAAVAPVPPAPAAPACFRQRRGGGEESFACAWLPATGGPISWTQELPPAAGATIETFRVPIPPLDARSYFVFKFAVQRQLTAADLQQFRASALAALDPMLRQVGDVEATTAQSEAMRRALVAALQGAACPGLTIVSDNLFDLAIPYERLADAYKVELHRLVGDVLNAQDRVRSNLQSRSRYQPDLQGQLDTIAESAALDELIAGLRARVAAAPTGSEGLLQEFLDQHAAGLGLAALTAPQRAAAALGQAGQSAGTASPPVVETIDPAAAGGYAASYRATQGDLGDLRDWLESLVEGGNRRLVDELVAGGGSGLSAADAATLPTVLAAVRRAQALAGALANAAEQVQRNQAQRASSLAELVDVVEVQARAAGLIVDASTVGNFKTQQAWYISADFGFAAASEVEKAVPYIGTNIYLRPVNKDAPLRDKGGFLRRFAFTLGLTVKSIADDPQTRDDLFDNNSLLLGGGLRVTDSARLGLGALVFEERDPNPLIQDESLTFAPYLSLSFDWDVLEFFKGFSGLFPSPGG